MTEVEDMPEGIPLAWRAYGVLDRALTRGARFRILGKAPAIILRNRLNRLMFRTVFAGGGEGVVRLARGPRLLVRFNDQAAASLVFEGEKSDATAHALLSLAGLVRGFFDVGANYGYFAIVAGYEHPDLPVVAVEPNPGLARLISGSIGLNGLHYVTVVAAACGAQAGTATLSFSSASSGTGALNATLQPGAAIVATPVVTIDELFFQHFVNAHDKRPVLLKIDVEGYEVQALRGAQRTLATRPIIVCELSAATFGDVQQIVSHSGLRVHDLDGRIADPSRLFAMRRKNTDVLICDPAQLGQITSVLRR
jgi:FkbM family methyltransferase